MKSAKQYNEMTQTAAYKIVKALAAFDKEPDHIRAQAEQIIMQRVQLMRVGQHDTINGDGLVFEVVDEPAKTEEEKPETETPAA